MVIFLKYQEDVVKKLQFLLSTILVCSASRQIKAENIDSVKLNIGTQTYQCTITNQNLDCKPVNDVERKIIDINKNNGHVQIADAPKGLSVDLNTNLNNGNVIYNITLCSNTSCSINNVYSGATGAINQIMLGQYNITEKSFFVLGVSLTNSNKILDIGERVRAISFAK
jgi:hypothetical protein